jgi:hypothetical protein
VYTHVLPQQQHCWLEAGSDGVSCKQLAGPWGIHCFVAAKQQPACGAQVHTLINKALNAPLLPPSRLLRCLCNQLSKLLQTLCCCAAVGSQALKQACRTEECAFSISDHA